jgi:hypothetical protein
MDRELHAISEGPLREEVLNVSDDFAFDSVKRIYDYGLVRTPQDHEQQTSLCGDLGKLGHCFF